METPGQVPPPPPFRDTELGNWKIEFNYPFGFVVKSKATSEEYHFSEESNGWVTSKYSKGEEATILTFSTMSLIANQFYPAHQLVDKQSTAIRERVLELKDKEDITPEEKDELLELSGLKKPKK